jgi:hypothetical protein
MTIRKMPDWYKHSSLFWPGIKQVLQVCHHENVLLDRSNKSEFVLVPNWSFLFCRLKEDEKHMFGKLFWSSPLKKRPNCTLTLKKMSQDRGATWGLHRNAFYGRN